MIKRVTFLLVLLFVAAVPAHTASWQELTDRLVADGLDRDRMQRLLNAAAPGPISEPMGLKIKSLYIRKYGSESTAAVQRKLAELGYRPGPADGRYGAKTRKALALFQEVHRLPVDGRLTPGLAERILASDEKAPPGKTPPELGKRRGVYGSILTDERLSEARDFYLANHTLLSSLERQYGVPREVAVGVLTVETRLGRYLGDENAFLTLASMAACHDYDCIKEHFVMERITESRRRYIDGAAHRKSEWAYEELKALIEYCRQAGLHPLTLPGSVYGAIGISQFMPTNAVAFGVDGDGDGVVNLFGTEDALHTMANFMRYNAGDRIYASRRRQRKALYRYNPSRAYVNTVMAVADHLRTAASN
jgi:membrane-bound lytic murein transglycosylase B